jgi:hypothetical protein
MLVESVEAVAISEAARSAKCGGAFGARVRTSAKAALSGSTVAASTARSVRLKPDGTIFTPSLLQSPAAPSCAGITATQF